jgi:hypothetical protein
MVQLLGKDYKPVYSVGDLVKRAGGFSNRIDKDAVGIVIDILETVGKLSIQIPYSYVVKWPDDSTSEYGATAIKPAGRNG